MKDKDLEKIDTYLKTKGTTLSIIQSGTLQMLEKEHNDKIHEIYGVSLKQTPENQTLAIMLLDNALTMNL